MTDEQAAALINARAVMSLAVIQGMIAENQRRESEGCAQAYCENSFFEVRDELDRLLFDLNFVKDLRSLLSR